MCWRHVDALLVFSMYSSGHMDAAIILIVLLALYYILLWGAVGLCAVGQDEYQEHVFVYTRS